MQGGRSVFVDAVHVRVGHLVSLFQLNEIDQLPDNVRLATSARQMQRRLAHLVNTGQRIFTNEDSNGNAIFFARCRLLCS